MRGRPRRIVGAATGLAGDETCAVESDDIGSGVAGTGAGTANVRALEGHGSPPGARGRPRRAFGVPDTRATAVGTGRAGSVEGVAGAATCDGVGAGAAAAAATENAGRASAAGRAPSPVARGRPLRSDLSGVGATSAGCEAADVSVAAAVGDCDARGGMGGSAAAGVASPVDGAVMLVFATSAMSLRTTVTSGGHGSPPTTRGKPRRGRVLTPAPSAPRSSVGRSGTGPRRRRSPQPRRSARPGLC